MEKLASPKNFRFSSRQLDRASDAIWKNQETPTNPELHQTKTTVEILELLLIAV